MDEHQAEVTHDTTTEPSADDPQSMIGRDVGPYRIAREVGRGGMGTVYEARRVDGEFQHRVAIKLVNAGLDNNFVIKRFRNERQILAALDHPNIGRLLGGGTTAAGDPYFVMEYIEGEPLYKYAETHHLNIADRLRLFIEVCDAVHYAHEKLVIHRDIKPTNIMVSSSGVPKLLDFGIAKLLNPQLVSDTTPQTTLGVRLMTIEYASPEQVQAQPVTFRSDQIGYSLLEIGETERALAEVRESVRLMPRSALPASILCFALVAAGLREEAERVRAEMVATAEQHNVKEYFLATAHVALGDYDEALNCLEKAAAERDPWAGLVWN